MGDKRENKAAKGGVNELAGRVTRAWLGEEKRAGSEEWQAVVVVISGCWWWLWLLLVVLMDGSRCGGG